MKEEIEKRIKKRESPAGYHFYHTYADCPRKWYLKYACGYRPEKTSKALIYGGVIHEAVEVFYRVLVSGKGDPVDAMVKKFKEDIALRKEEYENEEDYEKDRYRGPLMLDFWASRYGLEDLEKYEVLAIEEELKMEIGEPGKGFLFTVRPDRVFKDRSTGAIYVVDTKTTGWSLGGSLQGAVYQDQMTSYVWALKKNGLRCNEALVDVIYMRGKSLDTKRSDPLFFTEYALAQFELGMFGIINEVSSKYQKLKSVPNEILFPRYGESCMKFGCVYSDICRERANPGKAPYGFELDEWYIEEDMQKAQRAFGGKDET